MQACGAVDRVSLRVFASRRISSRGRYHAGLRATRTPNQFGRVSAPVVARRVSYLRAQISDKGDNEDISLSKQLGEELSILDDTLIKLKDELKVAQQTEEQDATMLAQLVDEVKAEQQSWLDEVEEMDRLMAEAAELDESEAEMAAMRDRYESLTKKIELFSGLLNQREREVESLQTQLEDVQQMGEVKKIREQLTKSKRKVVAGSAAVGADVQTPDSETIATPANYDINVPYINVPKIQQPAKPLGSPLPSQPQKKKVGMEAPGVVIVSALILAARLTAAIWKTVTRKMSKETRTLVETIVFTIVAMGIASIASHI